jgi:PTS system nitrogen regulatory IIA component
MDIKDFLSPKHVLIDIRASDKASLLRELARLAAAALDLPADRISGELLKREELGSTGTGGGVAIPHAATVARKLRDRNILQHLRSAASGAELYDVMVQ